MAGEQIRKTPMGGVKAFDCRNCGGQVQLLAPGQSLVAACKHCGAVADLTDDNFRILSSAAEQLTREPRYEIGSKATFDGKTWVVIGFMSRIVRMYAFEWEEYLLFNPYHGFRFLAHAYGHWSWIQMINDGPLAIGNAAWVQYKGQNFKLLTTGEAEVSYVLGEFYWQVRVGDRAQTRDLVAPPNMLSGEFEDGGMIWSLGQYLEPQFVEQAFGAPPKNKLSRKGVGANQPNTWKNHAKRIVPAWIISMILTVVIGIAMNAAAPDQTVLTMPQTYPDTTDRVSPPFELVGGSRNVNVGLEVVDGLDNHWVEFEGVLHNLETNENYEFVVGAEYYFGVTEGESWTEGSKSGDFCLNEVPAGNYEMVTSSASDSAGNVVLTVVRGVPIFSNMFIAWILLSILPVTLLIMSKNFEKQRNA